LLDETRAGNLVPAQPHPGDDTMPPPGQDAEHPTGVFVVARLAEDRAPAGHERVRREDPSARVPPRDLGGFRVGQAPGRSLRGFAVDQRLIDIGVIDLKGNSEGPEDLRPAGGGRGEDEGRFVICDF